MKQSLVLVFAFSLVTALSGCSAGSHGEVLAIEKTGTYHRPGCPLVNMAKTTPMSVAEAKAEKLKPCPGCKPDSI